MKPALPAVVVTRPYLLEAGAAEEDGARYRNVGELWRGRAAARPKDRRRGCAAA